MSHYKRIMTLAREAEVAPSQVAFNLALASGLKPRSSVAATLKSMKTNLSRSDYLESVSTVVNHYQEEAFLKKTREKMKAFWKAVKKLRTKFKKYRAKAKKEGVSNKYYSKNIGNKIKTHKLDEELEDDHQTEFEKLLIKTAKGKKLFSKNKGSNRKFVIYRRSLKALEKTLSLKELEKALKEVYEKDKENIKKMKSKKRQEFFKSLVSPKSLITYALAGGGIGLMSIASVLMASSAPIINLAMIYMIISAILGIAKIDDDNRRTINSVRKGKNDAFSIIEESSLYRVNHLEKEIAYIYS